jgi:hypothetical protein
VNQFSQRSVINSVGIHHLLWDGKASVWIEGGGRILFSLMGRVRSKETEEREPLQLISKLLVPLCQPIGQIGTKRLTIGEKGK